MRKTQNLRGSEHLLHLPPGSDFSWDRKTCFITQLNGNKQLETVVVFTFIQPAANRALMASTYVHL